MRERRPRHGGDLEWAAETYGLAPEDFLDFSSNVNPLGPPPRALEAARSALCDASRYPEPDARGLKAVLARFLGLEEEHLMLGNGSTELIHHLVRWTAMSARRGQPEGETRPPEAQGESGGGEGLRVAITVPAFGEYERAARNARAEVLYHQMRHEDGFSLDGPRLAATAAKCHLTFFCNPASPTGHLYGRRELLGVLEACRGSGGTLVLDESFMGFCSREEAARATLLPEVGEGGLVVISTLTKIYALAGLRGPGWLAGPRGLVSALEEAASPWRVNVAAQAAAMAALEDGAYLEMTRAAVRAWREELADGLRATGMFEVFPSHADFLLLRVSRGGLEAGELADALGIRGVLVRDCRDFRGLEKGFLRVAVRRPEENRRLLEALAEAVADKRA